MWRRSAFVMVLSGAALAASIALAQQKPAAGGNAPAQAAGGAQTQNPAVQQVSAQNYYFEWGLVIVMTGVALYAVCRSSRRNV